MVIGISCGSNFARTSWRLTHASRMAAKGTQQALPPYHVGLNPKKLFRACLVRGAWRRFEHVFAEFGMESRENKPGCPSMSQTIEGNLR
jgi:hypothetical protein